MDLDRPDRVLDSRTPRAIVFLLFPSLAPSFPFPSCSVPFFLDPLCESCILYTLTCTTTLSSLPPVAIEHSFVPSLPFPPCVWEIQPPKGDCSVVIRLLRAQVATTSRFAGLLVLAAIFTRARAKGSRLPSLTEHNHPSYSLLPRIDTQPTTDQNPRLDPQMSRSSLGSLLLFIV